MIDVYEDVVFVNRISYADELLIIDMINAYQRCWNFDSWLKSNRDFEWIGRGENAFVYSYKNYAIKVRRNDRGSNDAFVDDYIALERLQGSKYFPKLYFYGSQEFMVVELKSGRILENIENTVNFNNRKKLNYEYIRSQVEECISFMYASNVAPSDVHGKNVIINEENSEFCIVDVGNFYLEADIDVEGVWWMREDFMRRIEMFNNRIDHFEELQRLKNSKAYQQVM